MLTGNQQVSAKEALSDLASKIHGFIEHQEKDEFASMSLCTTSDDDERNFEKH